MGFLRINHLLSIFPWQSTIEKDFEIALWKFMCPRRVNILVLVNDLWSFEQHGKDPAQATISLFVSLKLPFHLFFKCPYASRCQSELFMISGLNWVLNRDFPNNVQQILLGVKMEKQPNLPWFNTVKALLSESWFGRNQLIFQEKASSWSD